MIPATAGTILTEERLRAYLKCSEFFHFGGETRPATQAQVTQYVFEYIIASSIRREILDPLVLTNRALYKITKKLKLEDRFMENQVEEFRRRASLQLNEILQIFPLSTYLPIYAPFEFQTRILKTPIRLRASGLFRSEKNQTLHTMVFSPYDNTHDILNDPTIYLKLYTLKDFVAPHASGRPQCKVHIFGQSPNQQLIYDSMDTRDSDPKVLSRIESVIRVMESGYHYPTLPCKYSCPYRQQCKI